MIKKIKQYVQEENCITRAEIDSIKTQISAQSQMIKQIA